MGLGVGTKVGRSKQGLALVDIQTDFPTSSYMRFIYYKVKLRREIIIQSYQRRS